MPTKHDLVNIFKRSHSSCHHRTVMMNSTTGWNKNRFKFGILLVASASLYVCYHELTIGPHGAALPSLHTGVDVLPRRDFTEKDVKRILFWGSFGTIGNELDNMIGCLKDKPCRVGCEATTNDSEIFTSDAVMFMLTDLWPDNWALGTRKTIEFPRYRRPDQVWVVSNLEPPQHLFGDIRVFNGKFNWTFWYRSDSTVVWPYGAPARLTADEQARGESKVKGRNFHAEKTQGVAGLISNCFAISKRYELIREMRRYIDIDMYGGCYDRQCGDENVTCDSVIGEYRFYLAFENAHCKDYVTEKYWRTLEKEVIPIVNWKTVNTSLVIPGSYINVYDFKDVKSLTEYIKKVNENEFLYNSYHAWRRLYRNDKLSSCQLCDLCHALHDTARPAQVIADLDGWVKNDYCEKVSTWTTLKTHFDRWKFDVFG